MTATAPEPILKPSYTLQETADLLGVSKRYLEKEVAAGRLKSFMLGRYRRVRVSDLRDWQEGQLERSETARVGRAGRRELSPAPKPGREVRAAKKDYSHIDPDVRERLGLGNT